LPLPKPTEDEQQKLKALAEQEIEEHPANKALLQRAEKKHMAKLCSFLISQFGLHEQWHCTIS